MGCASLFSYNFCNLEINIIYKKEESRKWVKKSTDLCTKSKGKSIQINANH